MKLLYFFSFISDKARKNFFFETLCLLKWGEVCRTPIHFWCKATNTEMNIGMKKCCYIAYINNAIKSLLPSFLDTRKSNSILTLELVVLGFEGYFTLTQKSRRSLVHLDKQQILILKPLIELNINYIGLEASSFEVFFSWNKLEISDQT